MICLSKSSFTVFWRKKSKDLCENQCGTRKLDVTQRNLHKDINLHEI